MRCSWPAGQRRCLCEEPTEDLWFKTEKHAVREGGWGSQETSLVNLNGPRGQLLRRSVHLGLENTYF